MPTPSLSTTKQSAETFEPKAEVVVQQIRPEAEKPLTEHENAKKFAEKTKEQVETDKKKPDKKKEASTEVVQRTVDNLRIKTHDKLAERGASEGFSSTVDSVLKVLGEFAVMMAVFEAKLAAFCGNLEKKIEGLLVSSGLKKKTEEKVEKAKDKVEKTKDKAEEVVDKVKEKKEDLQKKVADKKNKNKTATDVVSEAYEVATGKKKVSDALRDQGAFTKEDEERFNKAGSKGKEEILASKGIAVLIRDGMVHFVKLGAKCYITGSLFLVSEWAEALCDVGSKTANAESNRAGRFAIEYAKVSAGFFLIFGTQALFEQFVLRNPAAIKNLLRDSLGWPVTVPMKIAYLPSRICGMLNTVTGTVQKGYWKFQRMTGKIKASEIEGVRGGGADSKRKFLELIEDDIAETKKMKAHVEGQVKEIAKLKKTNPTRAKELATELEKTTKEFAHTQESKLGAIVEHHKGMRRNFLLAGLPQAELEFKEIGNRAIRRYIQAVDTSLGARIIHSVNGRLKVAAFLVLPTIFLEYKKEIKDDPKASFSKLIREIGPEVLQVVADVISPFGASDWYTLFSGQEIITGKNVKGWDRWSRGLWGMAGATGDLVGVFSVGAGSIASRSIMAGLRGIGKADKIKDALKILPKVRELGGTLGWKNLFQAITDFKSGKETALSALKVTSKVANTAAILNSGTQLIGGIAYQMFYAGPDDRDPGVDAGSLAKDDAEEPKGVQARTEGAKNFFVGAFQKSKAELQKGETFVEDEKQKIVKATHGKVDALKEHIPGLAA